MAKTLKRGEQEEAAIDANNAKQVIRDAAKELIRLKAKRAEIGEQITEVRGRVKGLIKMADFNVALRLYELEDEDRDGALDGMRLAFEALGIGEQGSLFPEPAPSSGRSNGSAEPTEAAVKAAGEAAGKAGRSATENPFAEKTHANHVWHQAWLAGQKALAEEAFGAAKKRRNGSQPQAEA